MQSIGATPSVNLQTGVIAAAETGGNGNSFVEPGEGGTLSIQLLNTGPVNATGLSATLTTTTPGVVVTTGASAYANLTAASLPLPVELGGAKVISTDSAGVARPAPLFFASPWQIFYLIPDETALGTATVTVIGPNSVDSVDSAGVVSVAEIAPSLFTANGDGQGAAAAVVLRIRSDGSRSVEPVVVFDTSRNEFVASPIDLDAPGDQVFLICFGAGLSAWSSVSKPLGPLGPLADLKTPGGETQAEVTYAGPQGEFAGLDQINLSLPRSLAGSGEVEVAITLNGRQSNAVKIKIR